MAKMKPLAVLKTFFGFRKLEFRDIDPETGQQLTGMQDFAKEIKNLTAEEKDVLVIGAAKELGVEVDRT